MYSTGFTKRFTVGNISIRDCDALDRAHCFVVLNNDWPAGVFLGCRSSATVSEDSALLAKIGKCLPSRALYLQIFNIYMFDQDVLQPVADNIIHIEIAQLDNFHTRLLSHSKLPNLTYLSFNGIANVTVCRNELTVFPNLQVISFGYSTISFLEPGVFEQLPTLQILQTDGFVRSYELSSSVTRNLVWKLHCSLEYSWLRNYFKRYPRLTKSIESGYMYNFPGLKSYGWDAGDLFYPTDCSRADLSGDKNQTEFSLNAP